MGLTTESEEDVFSMDGLEDTDESTISSSHAALPPFTGDRTIQRVEMTPCSFVPDFDIVQYLGRVSVHLIKETNNLSDSGGIATFLHEFLAEVNCVARAHVVALGGNVLLGYSIDKFMSIERTGKNQSYCLISVSGDAVHAVCTTSREGMHRMDEFL